LPESLTGHYADGGLCGALLRQEAGIPYTFTGHSLGAQKMDKLGASRESLAGEHAHFYFGRRILAERVSMSHAGRIITSTTQERMEQYGHRAYRGAVDPSDEGCFAVVPPGVNLRVFSPQSAAIDAAIGRHIDKAVQRDIAAGRRALPMVVASSRLDEKKNHLGLVEAFASSELQTAANLAIVVRGLDDPLNAYGTLSEGERRIMDRIRARMDEVGLWGKVTAFPLNSQLELAAAYRVLAGRGSVFALTALYEPFGLAPLEAMSCGLPAVVTQNGGPSESLREGEREFGVLVDPADPEDIARGLVRALGPGEAWARLQAAGRERVLSRYTWERTAEGYLRVLDEIVSKPPDQERVPIPPFFTTPAPENDVPLAELAGLYFGGSEDT
jgi:sucrose-phosphate synthase